MALKKDYNLPNIKIAEGCIMYFYCSTIVSRQLIEVQLLLYFRGFSVIQLFDISKFKNLKNDK